MGDKSASNIIASIENSKNTPYHKVIYALGIRHVGETVAKILAQHFTDINALMSAGMDELTSINEIGPKIASSIINYFSDKENRQIIERLKTYGIKLSVQEQSASVKQGKLSGKTIVISGVFSRHSREEYKEMIEKHGGKNTSSVSGNTSFILAGENMGQSKREKAKSLGIPIISEDEFLKMLE